MATCTDIKHLVRDRAGVSFLIALVGFLVAAVVSATIVAAAYSNVRQQANSQQNQQDLLTLQSTSNFLTNQITSTSNPTKLVVTEVDTYHYQNPSNPGSPTSSTKTVEASGFLKAELEDSALTSKLFPVSGTPTDFTNGQLYVTATVRGSSDPLASKVTFVLKADGYKLIMTVHATETSGTKVTDKAVAIITLNGNAVAEPSTETTPTKGADGYYTKKVTTKTTITWNSPDTIYSQPTTS